MNHSPETDKLFPALLAASANFEPLKKAKPGAKTKEGVVKFLYADMSAVMEVVRQPLADAGLFVTHVTTPDALTSPTGEPIPIVEVASVTHTATRLIHAESGQWVESALPLDMRGTVQELGSQLTYLHRYCLLGLLSLAPEDDDGAASSKAHKPRQAAPKRSAKPQAPPTEEVRKGGGTRDPEHNLKTFWASVRDIMAEHVPHSGDQEDIVRARLGADGFESTRDMTQPQRTKFLKELAEEYGGEAKAPAPPDTEPPF